MKLCATCLEKKTLDEFYKSTSGHRADCKTCQSKKSKARYRKNNTIEIDGNTIHLTQTEQKNYEALQSLTQAIKNGELRILQHMTFSDEYIERIVLSNDITAIKLHNGHLLIQHAIIDKLDKAVKENIKNVLQQSKGAII